MASNNSTFSVIGSDIKIEGNISASADLHVDGSIEGDIKCTSLVQGESSEVSGGITAESARLAGKVSGSINAKELVILKSARIEGDVHYDALTIEQGAQVDGRFAPNARRGSAGAAGSVQAPRQSAKPAKEDDSDQAQLKIAT
ncbi:bactofilin family protein [Erythrobacter rubeus]|uniref:Polymer-forming cytoskeletal protein n=1 Tax=Erythrobacter rubeus TaxID=2760803 RepID=A0ABR8KV05_9SPHN|nr:polymer-forming cytoskeletal protein [Erythrobacter rubeus]MBD2843247.1 polymer-forming cytoskeletal protein [Erythrobacter rubeus]